MSAHVHYNAFGEAVIANGFFFQCNYAPPNETSCITVATGDLLYPVLRDHIWFVPSGAGTIAKLLGFVGGQVADVDEIISFKPLTLPRRDAVYDEQVYGNFLHNLQVFDAFLAGRTYNGPQANEREHPCRHFGYSGELMPRRDSISESKVNFSFYGYNAVVRWYLGKLFYGAQVTSLHPTVVTPTFFSLGESHCLNVVDLLDAVKAFGEVTNTAFYDGSLVQRVLSNLSYSLDGSRLVVQYHSYAHNLSVGDEWHWDSEIVINFVPITPATSPVVGGFYTTAYTSPTIFRFRGLTSIGYGGTVGRDADEYIAAQPYWAAPIPLSDLGDSDWYDAAQNVSSGIAQMRNSRFLASFQNAVESEWLSITPSSAFSAVDAFLEAEGDLGVDSLQNLVKIPKIASAIPQIREAVDVLGRLLKRDLSLSTVKEILDLASSTVLQANFQWEPYRRLLFDYLPNMVSALQQLSDQRRKVVGYGSFRFGLTNQLGRSEVTLLTRTKIVLDTSPHGLLSTLIGLDILGVIPKPSNLWDLVPFSFVVNWFTGVGAALKRAEYSVLSASIPAYYVHTYTLTSPLSEDELESLGLSSANSLPVKLRVFKRDVSIFSPSPADSKFGFGIPTKFPPLGTVASLLYQLIFS